MNDPAIETQEHSPVVPTCNSFLVLVTEPSIAHLLLAPLENTTQTVRWFVGIHLPILRNTPTSANSDRSVEPPLIHTYLSSLIKAIYSLAIMLGASSGWVRSRCTQQPPINSRLQYLTIRTTKPLQASTRALPKDCHPTGSMAVIDRSLSTTPPFTSFRTLTS